MAIVFALGAALAYGSADFMGGIASRRASALAAAFGAQLAGLVLLVVALPILSVAPPTADALAAGAVAGLFGGTGVVLLFKALARGPMSVVAPTTALSASLVPILAGVLLGERPGSMTVAGIGVSLVAVLLITREAAPEGGPVAGPVARSVVPLALGGGAIFGLFFVFLHQAGPDAGLWPLLGARAVSVPMLALLVHRSGVRLVSHGPAALRSIGLSGLLDMSANILYLLALQHGMLTVVAAVTGLYPASTVLLAQRQLDERLQRPQVAGLGVAAVAALLIAS